MKKIVFGFKIYYLLNMLTAFITFFNYTKWFYYSNYLLIAGMCVPAVWLLVKWKNWMKKGNVILIILFLLSYLFSSAMTVRLGISDNLKELVWMFLPMVILYFTSFLITKEERKKEVFVLGSIHVIYCTIANIVSLSMVWWGRNYKFMTGPRSYRKVGFKWERLWGVYDDPNHGAAIAVIAVLLAVYLMWTVKNRVIQILFVLSILVQCGYIVCSDSRAAFGALGIGAACWTAWVVYSRTKNRKAVYRILISALISGAICVGIIVGGYVGNEQYMKLDKRISAERLRRYPLEAKESAMQGSRTQDVKEDSTSGRFAIWESGIELAKTSPIYGVSYRNIIAYAHKYVPDTYIINTKYDIDYDSMHNLLLDTLVSQGIIGVVLLLAIFVRSYWIFIRNFRGIKKEDRKFLALQISIIFSLGAGSMLMTTIVYLSGPHAYWFWMALGSAVALLQESEGNGVKAKE